MKKYLTDEIIENRLKKENTSKKNSNTHRNTIKNLNTTNVFLPYPFTVDKFLYSSFLLPIKFVESTCFLKNAIPLKINLLEKIISHLW